MPQSTPFFAAFGPLLFGRKRLSELDRLLQELKKLRSLSELHEVFGQWVPPALLAKTTTGKNSRERIFPMSLTFWAFLGQVLERGSACRDAVRRVLAWWRLEDPGRKLPSEETNAYCTARARLPEATIDQIGTHLAERMEANVPERELWRGRRLKVVDGTTASMPDTPENQEAWPQPSGQQPGCGFPQVKMVALFSLSSGALLQLSHGDRFQHELQLARPLWKQLEKKDVLLGDRAFCSYADICAIQRRQADFVTRLHQARRVDFTKSTVLGLEDKLETWQKPSQCPPGLSVEEYQALPQTLTVRVLRYRIEEPGFRTREVILVTTLLDAKEFPSDVLAELYFRRWTVELHLRQIKISLGLDVLRCLSPHMIVREIGMHRVAYNMVRRLMQEAGSCHHIPLARISFKGTLDSLAHFANAIHAQAGKVRKQNELIAQLLEIIAADQVPDRPGRSEPRAKKRRPKNYQLLTKPRREMRVPAHRSKPRGKSDQCTK